MKIRYTKVTEVEKMPETCSDCPFWNEDICHLPRVYRGYEERCSAEGMRKRVKGCTLTIEED